MNKHRNPRNTFVVVRGSKKQKNAISPCRPVYMAG